MKRLLVLVVCALALSGCAAENTAADMAASAQPTPTSVTAATPLAAPVERTEPDFRGMQWGMTREEVAATEQAEPAYEAGDGLLYEGQAVLGMEALVSYVFDDYGLCTRAYCLFAGEREDIDAWIGDYRRCKAELIRQYGEPVYEGAAEGRADLSAALESGDEILTAEFETKNTVVTLMLWWDETLEAMRLDLSFEAKGL